MSRELAQVSVSRSLAEIAKPYELSFSPRVFTSLAARDSDDDTLLHRAAFRGDARDVRDLIALGADLNAAGDLGHTPLHYAVLQDHADIAEILAESGADVTRRDEEGRTPAELAILLGHGKLAKSLRPGRRPAPPARNAPRQD